MIDTLFGTPIDDLVYRPVKASIKTVNNIDAFVRDYVFDIHLDNYSESAISSDAIFVKGDKNTSVLKANIFKSGVLLNLDGLTITANVKEGSKKVVTVPVEILDNNGVVKINLPSTLTDERGTNTFELVLQSGDRVIVSPQYTYKVLNSLGEGVISDETELSVLQTLIQQVQESKTTVDAIVSELEVTQSDIDEILGMVGGL